MILKYKNDKYKYLDMLKKKITAVSTNEKLKQHNFLIY